MTNEEIKKIEAAINFVDYCTPAETNEDVELAGIAVEALEKQIPKKFEIDGYYPKDRVCPRCFEDFTKTDARCQDYEPWRYCPSCGQAIDWSESNE